MKDKLILGCGIGRCGTSFLSYFMFLNPRIAVWDGPGMGELFERINRSQGKLLLSDLHSVWGDEYQESTHGNTWYGASQFEAYYNKRIKERRDGDTYFISHVMGERWYSVYRDSFDCDLFVIYCGRDMVEHYRSFKKWYYVEGWNAEAYLDRIRGSLIEMDKILSAGIPVTAINVADYTLPDLRKRMGNVMKKVGLSLSAEQTNFMRYRRKLGPSKPDVNHQADDELFSELKKVKDFEVLKAKYDALRTKYEA